MASCLTKIFNEFGIISIKQEKKNKNKNLDLYIHTPVKKKWWINCYFSSRLNFGFHEKYTEGNIKLNFVHLFNAIIAQTTTGEKIDMTVILKIAQDSQGLFATSIPRT